MTTPHNTTPHYSAGNVVLLLMLLLIVPFSLARAQTVILTLTTSDYHGYHVSCFGNDDGSITCNATGGTSPYSYTWSNGGTTQTISGLRASYYHVTVKDFYGTTAEADINLTEPNQLVVNLSSPRFSNGFNLSCYLCSNGTINTNVIGGVTAYNYLWSNGATIQNLSNLDAGDYRVTVTDANGCSLISYLSLTKPDREDWTLSGNTGSSPGTHFLGNADNKSLIFKTNNIEHLRLDTLGRLKFKNFESTTAGLDLLFVDEKGVLQTSTANCLAKNYPWMIGGNNFGNGNVQKIGTCTSNDFVLIANNTEGLRVIYDAAASLPKVVIGGGLTLNAGTHLTYDYGLYVGRGILTEKVKVAIRTTSDWSDKVFSKNYQLPTLKELQFFIDTNKHLPGIPSAEEVVKSGIDLGEMDAKLLQKIEELTLYVLHLEKEINLLKAAQK